MIGICRIVAGVRALIGAAAAVALCGCGSSTSASAPPGKAGEPFRDAAAESGLDVRHVNGQVGKYYMPETLGAGAAVLDYNNDGRLDVFVVQGGPFEPGERPDPARWPRHRLFRNDLQVLPTGERRLHFTDATEQARLAFSDYGMGVAAADFDNDGWVDLLVTTFGRNRLLRNNGDGTFDDVTAAAGVGARDGWNTSAAWVDYDRDGLLDLFVGNYLEWTFANHLVCHSLNGLNNYCGPNTFRPARSRLFHNIGNGRFDDVSVSSGIQGKAGSTLGVIGTDLNGDGWPDLFVANDGMPNFLWINQKNGKFHDEALVRGCALNADGQTEANMGIVVGDFRAVGEEDLFVTHLNGEKNTYFCNLGGGYFVDDTAKHRLDAPSRPFTGFGVGALDYDNDGFLDLFVANGDVRIIESKLRAQFPLAQRNQLFRNTGNTDVVFEEIRSGPALAAEFVGRGVAPGDLDNDGDVDLVVTNNEGPVRLLLNQIGQDRHWIGLRVIEAATGGKRDALGAVALVERAGHPPLRRRVATDGSYLSSGDPRAVFGLGQSTAISRVEVRWPDCAAEEWHDLPVDRYHELMRGTGRPVTDSRADSKGRTDAASQAAVR